MLYTMFLSFLEDIKLKGREKKKNGYFFQMCYRVGRKGKGRGKAHVLELDEGGKGNGTKSVILQFCHYTPFSSILRVDHRSQKTLHQA